MSYRTFFVVRVAGGVQGGPNNYYPQVADSVTFEDISEGLLVERVYARLAADPITTQTLAEVFPGAMKATVKWIEMKAAVEKSDKTTEAGDLRGPYSVSSSFKPTNTVLLRWWGRHRGVAGPAITTNQPKRY